MHIILSLQSSSALKTTKTHQKMNIFHQNEYSADITQRIRHF